MLLTRVGRPGPRKAGITLALFTMGFLAIMGPAATQELDETETESCQLTTVVFTDSNLWSYPGRNATSATPVDLDCGPDDKGAWFDVMLVSIDEQHGAGYQVDQAAEVWKVQGFDDEGTLQYESPLTSDLPETATTEAMLVHTAELSKVTYFQAVHGGDTSNANSVHALVILEPVGAPDIPVEQPKGPPTILSNSCAQPTSAEAEELLNNPFKNQVWRLYYTLLGRPPAAVGLTFWAELRDDSAESHFRIAEQFYSLEEGRSAGLSEMSNEEFVEHLFANLGCRAPGEEGLRYWSGLLDDGAERWVVATWFSESSEVIRLSNTEYPLLT